MSDEMRSKWCNYLPPPNENFASRRQLTLGWARQTDENNVVIGITNAALRPPRKVTNLLVVRDDLHHKYFNDLQSGEYSPIGNTIDPQIIIGCESYLSALALAQRCDYWTTLVVCCFEPENIYPVLNAFHRMWPGVVCESSPDTRDRSLCDGTMYPPGDLTWLDFHMWEVHNRWAA